MLSSLSDNGSDGFGGDVRWRAAARAAAQAHAIPTDSSLRAAWPYRRPPRPVRLATLEIAYPPLSVLSLSLCLPPPLSLISQTSLVALCPPLSHPGAVAGQHQHRCRRCHSFLWRLLLSGVSKASYAAACDPKAEGCSAKTLGSGLPFGANSCLLRTMSPYIIPTLSPYCTRRDQDLLPASYLIIYSTSVDCYIYSGNGMRALINNAKY